VTAIYALIELFVCVCVCVSERKRKRKREREREREREGERERVRDKEVFLSPRWDFQVRNCKCVTYEDNGEKRIENVGRIEDYKVKKRTNNTSQRFYHHNMEFKKMVTLILTCTRTRARTHTHTFSFSANENLSHWITKRLKQMWTKEM